MVERYLSKGPGMNFFKLSFNDVIHYYDTKNRQKCNDSSTKAI